MKPTALLTLLLFLGGCVSVSSPPVAVSVRNRLVVAALNAYHADTLDYPKRLEELHPRYLSPDVPMHGERYPISLEKIWSRYPRIDLYSVPIYYRLDRDLYFSYERFDQDRYSLLLIYRGSFLTPALQDARL